MSVLVTGGAGFVGLAAAEALLGRDHVVVVDRDPSDEIARWLPGATILAADVQDADALSHIAQEHKVSAILHAAAVTTGSGVEGLAHLFNVNVLGTLTVCEVARRSPSVRRVVLVSSGAVVEGIGKGTIDEGAPLAPVSTYGASKIAAEQAARELLTGSAVDLHIARLGPIFGPFERATSARTRTSAVHALVTRALAGLPVRIREGRGGDWLYSRDAGQALADLLLAEGGLASDVFLLSGNRVTALSEFAAILSSLLPGWQADKATTTDEADIVADFTRAPFDCGRARSEFGFRPRPLAAALDDYLGWLRSEANTAAASSNLHPDQ